MKFLKSKNNVIDNLWIGDASSVERMEKSEFDCVVLMAEEYQPIVVKSKTSLRAPISDGPINKNMVMSVFETARKVCDHLSNGDSVLVTCYAGLNRSSFVCALVLCTHFNLSIDAAITLLRDVRSQYVLSNPHFEKFLREWYKHRSSKMKSGV